MRYPDVHCRKCGKLVTSSSARTNARKRGCGYCSIRCSRLTQKTPAERFMASVSPEPNTGCWLWAGPVNDLRGGYGSFTVGTEILGPGLRASHRASFHLFVGPITGGLQVCHHCDNPLCVNPSHLFLGTDADNMADMRAKGRQAAGETHGSAKLTADEVLAIRQSDEGSRALAKRYGVSQHTINDVRSGRRWGHLAAAQNEEFALERLRKRSLSGE